MFPFFIGVNMGKKTVTGSSTLIITGDTEVNYLRKTINTGILQGASLGSHINQSYLKGMGINLRSYYKYGRDYYTWGLPNTNLTGANVTTEMIERAILSTYGSNTWVIQTDFGFITNDYWREDYLVKNYGYDSFYDAMSRPPAGVDKDAEINYETISPTKVKFIFKNADGTEHVFDATLDIPKDVVLGEIYCSAQYRLQISKVTKPPRVSVRDYEAGDEDKTTIQTYTDLINERIVSTETTTVVAVDHNLNQTTITETDVVTIWSSVRIFYYKPGTGKYPEIDKAYNTSSKQPTVLPVVPLRLFNKDYTTSSRKDTELYKTSNILMKKLGLKIDEIGKELRKNDLSDVDHIFLSIGVPISTKQKDSIKYIHTFFRELARDHPNAEAEVQKAINTPYIRTIRPCQEKEYQVITYKKPTQYSIFIKSRDYSITLNHYGAAHKVIRGRIGKVNTYKKGRRGSPIQRKYSHTYDERWGSHQDWCEYRTYTKHYTYDEIYTQRQINENFYEEVTVYSLTQFNNIHNGHGQTTRAYNEINRNTLDTPFLIPADVDLLRRVGLVSSTQLTTECIGLTLNSYKVIKKKWYQKGIFKVVMAVIAIVAAVYGGAAFSAYIMSAYAAGGISAAMLVAAKTIAVSVAISYGVSFLTSKLAPELSLIIATIVAIAAITSLSISNIGSVDGLPFAGEMLATVPAINKGVEMKLQKMYADLQAEVELFGKYAEDKSAEVENAFKELAGNANIDVFQLIRATQLNLFETPNTFLSRTLNTEVNSLAISSVTDYVQNTLTLPKGLIS